MVQLPSAPRLSGKKRSAACAAAWMWASSTPASQVRVLLSGSTARMAFMRTVLRITCAPLPSGVAPPLMPVLPPCVTTGVRVSWQMRITAAVCAVSAGRTTTLLRPVHFFSQSVS